jgi:hypothetical protein
MREAGLEGDDDSAGMSDVELGDDHDVVDTDRIAQVVTVHKRSNQRYVLAAILLVVVVVATVGIVLGTNLHHHRSSPTPSSTTTTTTTQASLLPPNRGLNEVFDETFPWMEEEGDEYYKIDYIRRRMSRRHHRGRHHHFSSMFKRRNRRSLYDDKDFLEQLPHSKTE